MQWTRSASSSLKLKAKSTCFSSLSEPPAVAGGQAAEPEVSDDEPSLSFRCESIIGSLTNPDVSQRRDHFAATFFKNRVFVFGSLAEPHLCIFGARAKSRSRLGVAEPSAAGQCD